MLKVCGIGFTLERCTDIEMSPNNRLPFLMDSMGKCLQSDQLFNFCLALNAVSNSGECRKYHSIMHDFIRPVWMKAIWTDPTISACITEPLYTSKDHSLLLQKFFLWRHKRALVISDPSPDEITSFHDAARMISKRLDESGKFFGGDRPSMLDACVGADLALIPFYLPASHPLHKAFVDHHNLFDYSLRLLEFMQ